MKDEDESKRLVKLPFKSRLLGTDKFDSLGPDKVLDPSKMQLKRILGLSGSALLFLGVFMPIVSIPLLANINYFQNGKGDGILIIFLAIISFVLVLMEKYINLLITGFISLAVMTYTFITFQNRLAQASSQMQKQLENNPFKDLANVALKSVQLQWGCAVLIIGVVLLISAAVIKSEKS